MAHIEIDECGCKHITVDRCAQVEMCEKHADEAAEAEYAKVREEAYQDNGTCMFINAHAPGHPVDMKFHVKFDGQEWEELTEAEMVEKYGYQVGEHGEIRVKPFMHSSQWDFWYAP